MDKKLQCDKEVIKSLFSLLPLYLYIYTRRPSLLSHTGAVAQWRAMVAVAAMVPLTLISYPHMYIEYIRCASAVAQGRAMAAVDAMVPLTLLPLYLYKAPLTLIPYGCSGAMQGNGCSGCHGAPHSYTDGEQNRSLLHTTCAYGKQSKDLFYTCGKPRFFVKFLT